LDRFHLAAGLSKVGFVLGFVVPGYAPWNLGSVRLGRVLMAGYGVSVLVFAVALGYLGGSIAYGLMIAAHAISIIYLENYCLRKSWDFGHRFGLAFLTLIAVWLVVYHPAMQYLEHRWIVPLRTPSGVVIINRAPSPSSVRRNDWIAYRIEEKNGGGFHLSSGYGVERVLGMPGDRIEFTQSHMVIEGSRYPRRPGMPVLGELVVREKHWFVWPNLAITLRGQGVEQYAVPIVNAMGIVSETNYLGKPFVHWFGRHQLP
jgi:hypothetical protein